MAEEVHGQEGGGAAAECGEEEQRDLGDATQLMLAPVAVMDSFPLVDTVGQECEQIDRKEIIGQSLCDYFHEKFSFPAATSKWYFTMPRSIMPYPMSVKRARAATEWSPMSLNSNFC